MVGTDDKPSMQPQYVVRSVWLAPIFCQECVVGTHRQPRHATEPLGAGIPEPALDGRGGEVGAVHGVLLVPSLLRLAVLHVVRQVLLPLH